VTKGTIVGVQPLLPWPLSRSSWWTEPVRAERLAALRIGVGLVLLLDVLGTYLPRAGDFFGAGSLSNAGTHTTGVSLLVWPRVLLEEVISPGGWYLLLGIWALSAVLLMVGVIPRLAAAVAWYLSISIWAINPDLQNNGDQVRNILLFLLIFCPCGATWSLQSWWQRQPGQGPTMIYPWVLRLLLIQLVLIYFMNGLYKMRGSDWRTATALSKILGDVSWTRWSFEGWPMPAWLLSTSAVIVLVWELGFPLLLFLRPLGGPILALGLGVVFHVVTGLTMQIGPFPLYMLCLYLPLVPWERWAAQERKKPAASFPGGADTRKTAWRVQGRLTPGDSIVPGATGNVQ